MTQLTENSLIILKKRYLAPGESVDDLFHRVANGHEKYIELMKELRFLPNSPTLFNAGLKNNCTLSACFVFDVEDTMLGKSSSIVGTREKAVAVAKAGGGVGYYFGNLRPKGKPIRSIHGKACGPVTVLRDYHAISHLITQGGKRELAQMGVLNYDHPDILDFIHCKDQDPQGLGSFNISVSWTDEGIERTTVPDSPEKRLWDEQVKSAWSHGCPGMLFHDTVNRNNPNPHLGIINATNPCQPGFASVLTPYGIRCFDDIEVGSLIWSGKQWTKVINKIATGEKDVYQYCTTAGEFIGTENHKVFENGKRVQAGSAEKLDLCKGFYSPTKLEHDNQTIVDGWVIGDGTVHKASNNLVYLCLGEGDTEQFITDFDGYIVSYRPGIRSHAYEVQTTIKSQELPHTYNRFIPTRFRNGSPETICSFLRGLYAANGSVCGDRITLKATSLQVIKDVQLMLSSVGIHSYYTTNKSTEIEFPNGNYACKQSYDQNITSDRDVFDQLIGFIHLHKIKKLDTLLQTITPRKSAKTHDITEVINLGKHQVYDITVEAEEHSYWTGGVLVSNCGETPNRNNEPCNLGSLNLSKYFISENRSVDEDRLAEDAYTACCFLDDILDRNEFPHPDITEAAYLTRKLGLGVMGWADLLALMHIHYATEEAIHLGNRLMEIIRGNAFKASIERGESLGYYLGYSSKNTRGVARRNETVTSVAPTGTISIIAGCSSGIEPHYAIENERTTSEGIKLKEKIAVLDQTEGFIPKTAAEIDPEWHVRHQAAFQSHTDLGVSKTVNLPNTATIEDVDRIYRLMHTLGCKGGTIFRDGCRDEQVIVATKTKSVFTTGKSSEHRKLPDERPSITHKFTVSGTKCYVTVGLYEDNKPGEIFMRASKAGSTVNGLLDSWAMTFSIALQNGTPLEELIEKHTGARFEPNGLTTNEHIPICTSIVDYVVRWLGSKYLSNTEINNLILNESGLFCPECGQECIYESGCLSCKDKSCGWNRCG